MSRIRLDLGVDPLSPRANRERQYVEQPSLRLVPSSSLRSVTADLERYVRGDISGISFLVSGHRGAGKTTMVHGAIEEVLRRTMTQQHSSRPLLIRLNGPDLFALDPLLMPVTPGAQVGISAGDGAPAPDPGGAAAPSSARPGTPAPAPARGRWGGGPPQTAPDQGLTGLQPAQRQAREREQLLSQLARQLTEAVGGDRGRIT